MRLIPKIDMMVWAIFKIRSCFILSVVLKVSLVLLFTACTSSKDDEKTNESQKLSSIQCGSVLNSNYKLDGLLQCKVDDKIGLIISGDNLIIDGSNYQIEAPDAEIGLLVLGNNNVVKNFKINGLKNGTAILIFENSDSIITDNTLTSNSVGIDVYNNAIASNSIVVENNNVSDSYIGIRVRDEAAVKTIRPKVRYNDFSRAKIFGLQVIADEFVLSGDDHNIFDMAANGAFLQGRSIKLENINIQNAAIDGTAFFVFGTQHLNIENVDLSAAQSLRDSNGLHLYRVNEAQINNLKISNRDVGIKIATDSGIETQFYLNNSSINLSKTAGLMIQSYDSTEIDTVKILDSVFQDNPSGFDSWIVPGTIVRNN